MYLAYGVLYEGSSDAQYFDVLIPRILEDLIARKAVCMVDFPATPTVRLGKNGRTVEAVAREICLAREAVHIVFVHADTGGRALESGIGARSDAYCLQAHAECGFPPEACICIKVRHETEAWALGDPQAIHKALGFSGRLDLPGSALAAERLPDPKTILENAVRKARDSRFRKRDVSRLLPTIALNQSIDLLMNSTSFRSFYEDTAKALASLRFIESP